ncbi:MAG: hypothetical protein Q4A74_08185 [Cardiobacteriaceae bacterium]|nr:hypothetical protein [Cardiobacteriaceae bacterium]
MHRSPIDIFEINTSHVNPRHSRGENYDSIKASIKSIGLQTILTVTRLPGKEQYTLYNGGNTRLTILKELYQEYKDAGEYDEAEKLRIQHCSYVSYTNDLDSLIKQVAENDERSPMTFIDKARAVHSIREMYLQAFKVEDVSNRELVAHIHKLGWTSINHRVITELMFAYDCLEKVIPFALDAGMGKLKIQQLRVWLRNIKTWLDWLVQEYSYTYSVEQGVDLFFNTLSNYDSEDASTPINIDLFFEDYLYRLSDVLMSFDQRWTAESIRYELDIVAETGAVGQEKPIEELSAQLATTSTNPPATFPTPRKPREKSATVNNNDERDTDNIHNTDADISAKQPQQPYPDNPTSSEADNIEARLAQARARANTLQRHPPLTLPDVALSNAEYNQQTHEQCVQRMQMLLDQLDSSNILKSLIVFNGEDDGIASYDNPPYYFLFLDAEESYQQLHQWIQNANPGEQYAALYCVNLLLYYLDNGFDISEDEHDTKLGRSRTNLRRLWQEYAALYNSHQMACLTGLINFQYQNDDIALRSLMVADRLIYEHLGFIYANEMHVEGQ